MKNDPRKNIPTSVSSSDEWIVWHKSLRKWFSKQEANSYFVKFWNQRAGAGSDADTVALRSYMESQGVELQTTFSGEVADSFSDAGDWFTDTFNMTRALIFGAAALGLGLIAYYVIVSTKKGKSAGEMIYNSPISPVGRISNLKQLR